MAVGRDRLRPPRGTPGLLRDRTHSSARTRRGPAHRDSTMTAKPGCGPIWDAAGRFWGVGTASRVGMRERCRNFSPWVRTGFRLFRTAAHGPWRRYGKARRTGCQPVLLRPASPRKQGKTDRRAAPPTTFRTISSPSDGSLLFFKSVQNLVQLRASISIERVGTSILTAAPRDPACRRHDHLSTGFVQRRCLVERYTERGGYLASATGQT